MIKNSKKLIAFLYIATIGISCFTIGHKPICVQTATINDSITYDGLELRKTNEESFDNVEITTYSNIDDTLTYSKVIAGPYNSSWFDPIRAC
ncbi:hypothetical protein FC789_15165 [Clostridium botulinum]|uniref:hypothetical protein n=1 Tax=unclassified Clostridium TaxID=2614128 RepID=UPI0013F1228C|nr:MULTISPECIES: hypothetical protein [unclassified Clostridium]NFG42475.1 hypothetical protein [Clostridium botulinum]